MNLSLTANVIKTAIIMWLSENRVATPTVGQCGEIAVAVEAALAQQAQPEMPTLLEQIKALPYESTTVSAAPMPGRYAGPDLIDRDAVLALFAPKETTT